MNLYDPKDYYGDDWPEKKCGPDCMCQECYDGLAFILDHGYEPAPITPETIIEELQKMHEFLRERASKYGFTDHH